jgi:hypothetical protein
MGAVFSLIQRSAKAMITAMVQKQIENTVTKIKIGTMEELFGGKITIPDKPFSNNLKKVYPKADELPHRRALNERQQKRLEEKRKRKLERANEILEGKNLTQVAVNETKRQVEQAADELVDTAMNAAVAVVEEAATQVLQAAALAKGIFESYKKLFTDLGTSGEKVVTGSADLIATMVAAAPAILGTCALGPTVTPGALPQHIFAVKSKSDVLGTELSKFKSAMSELRSSLEMLGDFPGKDEFEDILDTVDTAVIIPQTLIMATGGLVCLLEVDLESMASNALEALVGDMAGPIMALATNKASLCDNWELKPAIAEELGENNPDELVNILADWSKHTKENCKNFKAMENQVLTDESGIPQKDPVTGKVMYERNADGSLVPKYKRDDNGNKVFSGCENCKNYKKNEVKAKEEEEKE